MSRLGFLSLSGITAVLVRAASTFDPWELALVSVALCPVCLTVVVLPRFVDRAPEIIDSWARYKTSIRKESRSP